MPDQTTLLAWGCVTLGVYLVGYALYSLRMGETRGYYRDHRYRRDDGTSRFRAWFWLRMILGLASLTFGIAFL